MAIDIHTVSLLPGTTLARTDRLILGALSGVASAAGGSAGAAVTVPVSFPGSLPANYAVIVTASQDATAYVTAKTASGFSVVLSPRLAANTLAAGTFDTVVLA